MNYNYTMVNCDTDAVMVAKPDQSSFSLEEQNRLLKEINDMLPEYINFKNDGMFKRVLCLKGKTYALLDQKDKLKIKGSALKSSTLEPILKQFLNEMVMLFINDRQDQLIPTYKKYSDMIDNITDIKPWAKKMTLSPTTFKSDRLNETKIVDAIKGKEYGSGDRIYVITIAKEVPTGELYKVGTKKGTSKMKTVKSLVLLEDFNGDYDRDTYREKLLKCVFRFDGVINVKEMFK